jgi:ferredoxin--NADP+ reductase
MTIRVAVVGAGPAGFAVASALLADSALDATVELVDRAARPDGLLRHGPAPGARRLRDVADNVDAVLRDSRVTFFGNVDIGAGLPLDELRRTADAVVLTTGAPLDLPLDIAGCDSVGVGTVSHVEAWLTGNADVQAAELDQAMDSAVLIGLSAESLRVAEVLCGRTPPKASGEAAERLTNGALRNVQLVDPRPRSQLGLPEQLPGNLIVRTELTPVGVVGRNRARALRCLHRPDPYGRVISEDLRAQLLLRPRARSFCWTGLAEDSGHIAQRDGRVLIGSAPTAGLYVAGWAGRAPSANGSHAGDAAAVVAALHADLPTLSRPREALAETLAERHIEASGVGGWSATAATDVLLDRFAGEGTAPLADYEAMLGQVDED